MKTYRLRLSLGTWLAAAACCLGADGSSIPRPPDYTLQPPVVQEESGRGPQRIVSLAPSITEMCAALGLAERIVGRTQFCTHPPAVADAAIVGAHVDTNLEKILELKPDLVVITAGSRVRLEPRLKSLGLSVEVLPDSSLDDVFQAITSLGRATQRPRTAHQVIDRLVRDLERLTERAGDHHGTRVLFTIRDLPLRAGPIYVAGPGGHLDELLRRAGYANATADVVSRPWAQISVETFMRMSPDTILEFRPAAKRVDQESLYAGWARLSTVPAIGNRRIRSLEDSTALIPGPRINIALHDVITALSER